jgi:hypothetical protein
MLPPWTTQVIGPRTHKVTTIKRGIIMWDPDREEPMGAILLWLVSQLGTCEAVNAGEEAPLSPFIVEL